MAETPDERKKRLLGNLEKAREVSKQKRAELKAKKEAGEIIPPPIRKRPRNLDKIIRDILDDETLVDELVTNQPAWWNKLPTKNAGYIISAVMTVKAMGGDIKAADWVAKRGFGDKVLLETDNGFFQRDQFTIQVVPAKNLDSGISSQEVLDSEIKQIEEKDADTTEQTDNKNL